MEKGLLLLLLIQLMASMFPSNSIHKFPPCSPFPVHFTSYVFLIFSSSLLLTPPVGWTIAGTIIRTWNSVFSLHYSISLCPLTSFTLLNHTIIFSYKSGHSHSMHLLVVAHHLQNSLNPKCCMQGFS